MNDQPKNITLRFKIGNLAVTRTRYVDHLLRNMPSGDVITELEPRASRFSFIADARSLFELKGFNRKCFDEKVRALQYITSVECLATLLETIPENVHALFAGHRYPFMVHGLFRNLLMYENSYLELIDTDKCTTDDDIGNFVLYGSMTLQTAIQELIKQSSECTAAKALGIDCQLLRDLGSHPRRRTIELSRYEMIAMRLYLLYGVHVSISPERVRLDDLT